MKSYMELEKENKALKEAIYWFADSLRVQQAVYLKALSMKPDECKQFIQSKFPLVQETYQLVVLIKLGENAQRSIPIKLLEDILKEKEDANELP